MELLNKKYGVSERILKVINFSTPYQGALISKLGLKGMDDLKMGKKRRYISKEKVVNIYPKIDNRIWPRESLNLKGSENIEIKMLGHARILEEERAINVLLEKIKY